MNKILMKLIRLRRWIKTKDQNINKMYVKKDGFWKKMLVVLVWMRHSNLFLCDDDNGEPPIIIFHIFPKFLSTFTKKSSDAVSVTTLSVDFRELYENK